MQPCFFLFHSKFCMIYHFHRRCTLCSWCEALLLARFVLGTMALAQIFWRNSEGLKCWSERITVKVFLCYDNLVFPLSELLVAAGQLAEWRTTCSSWAACGVAHCLQQLCSLQQLDSLPTGTMLAAACRVAHLQQLGSLLSGTVASSYEICGIIQFLAARGRMARQSNILYRYSI